MKADRMTCDVNMSTIKITFLAQHAPTYDFVNLDFPILSCDNADVPPSIRGHLVDALVGAKQARLCSVRGHQSLRSFDNV